MAPNTFPSRSWQDQSLPAPLIPAALAETVVLGMLRQQAQTMAAVAAGPALVSQTLAAAGINTSPLLLSGPTQVAGPDVCYLTSTEEAARFDELLSQVLCEPSPSAATTGSWLRNRTLAAARLKALSPADSFISLPEVDMTWESVKPTTEPARLTRWLLQAAPLPLLGFVALDVYIWNAGARPDLWPLLALPLAGALGFGGVLFSRLRTWRKGIALAWLARPARLRPDALPVAKELNRAPWGLLWLPPLLLVLAFLSIVFLLASAAKPGLHYLLVPVALALLAQVLLAWWRARRYLNRTRELVQGLPAGLLPSADAQGALWQVYDFY